MGKSKEDDCVDYFCFWIAFFDSFVFRSLQAASKHCLCVAWFFLTVWMLLSLFFHHAWCTFCQAPIFIFRGRRYIFWTSLLLVRSEKTGLSSSFRPCHFLLFSLLPSLYSLLCLSHLTSHLIIPSHPYANSHIYLSGEKNRQSEVTTEKRSTSLRFPYK